MTEADTYRKQSIDLRSKSIAWFLYDIGFRHEKVNQNVFYHLLLKKYLNIFLIRIPSYLDIFWMVVGDGGYTLAVGVCW